MPVGVGASRRGPLETRGLGCVSEINAFEVSLSSQLLGIWRRGFCADTSELSWLAGSDTGVFFLSGVVAFRRHSRCAPPRLASRTAIMVKKRGANQHTGKPFIEWCAENGKRGERLANEFREELPTELTKGSKYKAKWKCLKCKHVWRAQMCHRTRSARPCGCPKCANHGPLSKTHNFLASCRPAQGPSTMFCQHLREAILR